MNAITNHPTITPLGLFTVQVNKKFTIQEILDFDSKSLQIFASELRLPSPKRYYILYSLAINNLLLTPNGSDEISYILSKRKVLLFLDEKVLYSNGIYEIPTYNIRLEGKMSSLYLLLLDMVGTGDDKMTDFERSFHLLPNTFNDNMKSMCNTNEKLDKITNLLDKPFVINEHTLERTFNLIDTEYFEGLIKYRIQATGNNLSFKVSNKMIKTAGTMAYKRDKKKYVITIADKIKEVCGSKLNSGIICNGPVQSFIVTFQHELAHLIVYLEMERLGLDISKCIHDDPKYKSHGTLFKNIAKNYFGIEGCTHSMFSDKSDHMEANLTNTMARVGDKVKVKEGKGFTYGTIVKINPKRAKVDMEDGKRYNVPYSILFKK